MIKKKIKFLILINLLLPFPKLMALDELRLTHVEGEFFNEEGDFSFENVVYKVGQLNINSQNSNIGVSLKENILKAHSKDINLSYTFGKNSMLTGLKSIRTNDINLFYIKENRFSLTTEGITLSHSGGQQYIPQLSLGCRDQSQSFSKGLREDLLQCLSFSYLKIPEINFDQLSAKSMAKAFYSPKSVDSIKNIALGINKGSFLLHFKMKYLFNWQIIAKGTIKFDEEKGNLDIYIRSAKVGLISVKKTILKQIRQAHLDSVSVSGNHIFIQLL